MARTLRPSVRPSVRSFLLENSHRSAAGGERGVTAPSLALNVPSTLRAPFPWFGGKSKRCPLDLAEVR
jgi:hypothetical protein